MIASINHQPCPGETGKESVIKYARRNDNFYKQQPTSQTTIKFRNSISKSPFLTNC